MSMTLKRLQISNFRMFENLKLVFEPGFNLILGDNGVGKTTILEAASVALSGFFVGMEDVATRNIRKEDVRYLIMKDKNGTPNKSYCNPVEVTCTLQYDETDYTWTRAKRDTSGRTTITPREIVGASWTLVNDIHARKWPLINYQSASRHWEQRRKDANEKKRKQLHDRRCAYLGSLDKSVNLQTVYEWCKQMEWLRVKNTQIPENYQMFQNIISEFMSIMNDGIVSEVFFHPNVEKLLYVEDGAYKEIEDLSAGYQSVLNMVIDLAYRMSILNPDAGENIRRAEGVVLIDEIDSNLHPKWQWRVVDALVKTFPNLQFIAATHSPIIVSSCKNANIISIDETQEVQYLEDSYAFSVNEILRDMLGYHMRPAAVESLIDEFGAHMDRDEYEQARISLQQLMDILGNEHPDVIALKSEYEIEAGE